VYAVWYDIVWLVVETVYMYEYSRHAKYKMRERLTTEEEVEACLERHDTRYTDRKGNPIFKAELASGRGIKVIVAKDNLQFIITVADY